MPCPMRFVLVGVSAVVAAFLVVWPFPVADGGAGGLAGGKPAAGGAGRGAGGCRGAAGGGGLGAWPLLLLDMFTGRYLWDLYRTRHKAKAL